MVRYCVAVCVLLSAGWLRAAPNLTLAPLDPGLAGLKILLPTDPGFQDAVESIAAASDHTVYSPVLPYSFVLRNDTARPIIHLTVSALIDGQRQGGFSWASHSPNDVSRFAPGEQRVYSVPGGGTVWGRAAAVRVGSMASATTVVISLDSVLFADGVFAGPDVSGEFEKVKAMFTAEAIVANAVLSYKSGYDRGVRMPLEQYLSALSGSTVHIREYYRLQLQQAGAMYEGDLRRHGADEMFQLASEIAQGTAGFAIHR